MQEDAIPCRYFFAGCVVVPSDPAEKLVHEEMCDYRFAPCPIPVERCIWHGRITRIVRHLVLTHRLEILHGATVLFAAPNIHAPGETNWVVLQSCLDNHFMLILIKRQTPKHGIRFLAKAQLIGSKKKTERFFYRMELMRDSRRLGWAGRPGSLYDSLTLPGLETNYFIFSYATGLLFSEYNILSIKVTISNSA